MAVTDRVGARHPTWREVGGLLLTLLALGVFQPLAADRSHVPGLMVLYFVPLALSAYLGGLGAGLVSAGLGILFASLYLCEPGRLLRYAPDQAGLFAILVVSMPAVAVLIGRLKRRSVRQAEALAADRRLRETAEALAISEARYRMLLDEASDGILVYDPSGQGRLVDINVQTCKLSGYDREELVGTDGRHLVLPEDLDDVAERVAAMCAGRHLLFDRRWRRKDGTVLTMEVSAKQMPDGLILSIVRDVTEHRRMHEEVKRALSLHRATLESTADGILVVNREGRFVSWNRRFVELWRVPEDILEAGDDARGVQSVLDQVKAPEAFLAKIQEVYAQPEAESFDVIEFRDGRVLERYSCPHRVDGVSVGRVWSFRDVTERHLTQEALRMHEIERRQTFKLEAIGRLAGGVAHDFNNLLTVILGHAKILRAKVTPEPDIQQAVVEILWAAERAATLTRQLLAFSRRQMLEPRVIRLNDVVAGLQPMLGRLIGEHIQLRVVLSETMGTVRADPGQIEQVVLNLILNARDAMPVGGTLILETAAVKVEEPYALLHQALTPGLWVRLAVSDTGIGMDAETRERIFEPFFTTKRRGDGMGLGLSTVYGIVQQSGGHIQVYSEPGQGSTFKIYLPELVQAAEIPDPGRDARPIAGGNETLLVVEDEDSVRKLVVATLEPYGYQVLVAANGPEALEISRRHADEIHLMVTDVVMPRMSGAEVEREIKRQRPETRVLFMSGYTDEAIAIHGVLRPGVAFIEKPFDLDSLARRVRELLDAPVKDAVGG